MTKLLRTNQLDQFDTFVFENAAVPGEWTVSGAFAFWGGDPIRMKPQNLVSGLPIRHLEAIG